MRNLLRRLRHRLGSFLEAGEEVKFRLDQLLLSVESIERNIFFQSLQQIYSQPRFDSARRLQKHGYKVFSQHDEDGILAEIFRRIGVCNRTFVEFGVGDGLESNSTYLLLQGWRGLWMEADRGQYNAILQNLSEAISLGSLVVLNVSVTRENVSDYIGGYLRQVGIHDDPDLLSIDIDGNDFHVLEALSGIRPRAIVVEYNANYRPPLRWVMPYDPDHRWDQSMTFGASLDTFNDLLSARGYALVGCSIVGGNAFFIRTDLVTGDFEAPFTTANHYEPPRYWLSHSFRHHTWMRPAFPPSKAAQSSASDGNG